MYNKEIEDYNSFLIHLLEQAEEDDGWDAEGSTVDALTILE